MALIKITSPDNQTLKLVRKLGQKKWRYREEKFVIESYKMLEEAIQTNLVIDCLILREDRADAYMDKFSEIENALLLDAKLFNSLSTLETPDGFMAIVHFPKLETRAAERVLLLDRLQDPGNLGTIIRSAEAFGFENIFLLNSVDPYNDKSLRASMGSVFRVVCQQIKEDDLADLARDYRFYAADMDGKNYKEVTYHKPLCLVIGNEAGGISDKLMEISEKIAIPMQGQIESLNAAISAAVLMASMA